MDSIPPRDDAAPAPSTTLTLGSALSDAHGLLGRNYGLLLGATLLLVLLNLAIVAVAGLIDAALVGPDAMVQPVSQLASLLITTPLGIGAGMLAAMRYRDGTGTLSTLFIGFSRYGVVVLIALLYMIGLWGFIFIGAVVVGIAAAAAIAAAGSVGLVVPIVLGLALYAVLIYFAIRLWFATMLAVDPLGAKPGSIEAIQLSWYLTHGKVSTLFVTGVVLTLILIASILLLILPFVFYGLPLAACVTGVLYVLVCRPTFDDAGDAEPDAEGLDPLPA
ncbi:MAG: hypothetical protein AAFX79_04140 [Planctomycetota bacterium]